MSQIQDVKEANDIVEVIGSRIDLKRSGTNFRGLCPFHSEKSPSFFVNETLQRFRCFGCSESGDVFEFLIKYDGMTFYEALQHLAEKAGITLESVTRSPEDDLREQIKAVLDVSRQYYHYLLTEHQVGQAAREYLKDRGITQESINLFQIGYALPSWEGLCTYLHEKKKFPLAVIEKAGMIILGKNNAYYDRFRGRIMFPLKDHRGQVVGFSGRTMEQDVKEAKYINTPETSVYHKGKMLYGYSELFSFIRQEKKVVVVEGEFDVISSVQAHVNNVVALKGSALTEDHAKLLSRSVESVILSLDTDSAGIEATKKAIKVLRPTELELRAVVLSAGKDPDELAKKDPKSWREAVKQSVSGYDYLITAAAQKFDPTTPDGKRNIMKELGPILAAVPHAVELEYYLKELSQVLGVQKEVVRTDVVSYQRKGAFAALTGRGQLGAESTDRQTETSQPTRRLILEEYLLFLLLHASIDQLKNWIEQLFALDATFVNPSVTALLKRAQGTSATDLQAFARSLSSDQQQLLFELHSHPKYLATFDETDLDSELRKVFLDWKNEVVREQVAVISARLTELDAKLQKSAAEELEQDELLKKIVRLQS